MGRTPYFLIYDIETNDENYIANSAAQEQGGAGIKAAQIIIDSGAKSVIIPRLGKNAADVLMAGNIKLYRNESGSAKRNMELFKEEKLNPLTEFHAGFHGGF